MLSGEENKTIAVENHWANLLYVVHNDLTALDNAHVEGGCRTAEKAVVYNTLLVNQQMGLDFSSKLI